MSHSRPEFLDRVASAGANARNEISL